VSATRLGRSRGLFISLVFENGQQKCQTVGVESRLGDLVLVLGKEISNQGKGLTTLPIEDLGRLATMSRIK